jgi:hypothetical protein
MTIKLETNIPTILGFPFGDFQEKESQFGGVSYMCKATPISADGEEGESDWLFATKILRDLLVEKGITAGSAFKIIKGEQGGKTKWSVEKVGGPSPAADEVAQVFDGDTEVSTTPSDNDAPPAAAPAAPVAPVAASDANDEAWLALAGGLASALQMADHALRLASLETEFTSSDVEKLAVHLSITAQQRKMAPLSHLVPSIEDEADDPPTEEAPPAANDDDLPF